MVIGVLLVTAFTRQWEEARLACYWIVMTALLIGLFA